MQRHASQAARESAGAINLRDAADRSADESRAAAEAGLGLFRSGHRAEAMPHLEKAAAGGEPRAQYLLGVALFNGDHGAADPGRARVLLQAAAAAGIAQAQSALKEMTRASAPDPAALLSAGAAESVAADIARIRPSGRPTLESLTRELLVPLLRERLETGLPAVVRTVVDRTLGDTSSRDPSDRSRAGAAPIPPEE